MPQCNFCVSLGTLSLDFIAILTDDYLPQFFRVEHACMSLAESTPLMEAPSDAPNSGSAAPNMGAIRFRSFQTAEAAATHFEDLEADGAHCVYHCRDWLEAYQATLGISRKTTPLILFGFNGNDRPVLALPFQISERMGKRTLSWLGQDFSNQNTGIWSDEALNGDCHLMLVEELRRIAEANRIDLIHLKNIPYYFQGKRHPLLSQSNLTSPSPLFEGELNSSFDEIYRATHSSSARRQLRRKQEMLSELGPITMKRAETPEELERGIAAFFQQRAVREGDTGIPNVFDREDSMAFVRQLLSKGLDDDHFFTELWFLEVNETIRATWILGTRGRRLTGYANSIAHDETTPYSPGILLMKHIIEDACDNRDFTCIDLGLGEERYKAKWSNPVVLQDILLAQSARGRRALKLQAWIQTIKRAIRSSKHLWPLVRKFRKLKAKLRNRG